MKDDHKIVIESFIIYILDINNKIKLVCNYIMLSLFQNASSFQLQKKKKNASSLSKTLIL